MVGLQNAPTKVVAVAALTAFVGLGGFASRAYAACSDGGTTTVTCTGTISGTGAFVTNGGIAVGDGYDILNVNNLDADITPDSGTRGISFSTTGTDITVTTTLGDHSIQATGALTTGLYISAGGGDVTLNHTGDVSSQDYYAIGAATSGTGTLDATISGTISAPNNYGVFLQTSSGTLTADTQGTLTAGSIGLGLRAIGGGTINATNSADISGDTGGVALLTSGDLTFSSTGDITSTAGAAVALYVSSNAALTLGAGTTVHGGTYGFDASSTTATLNNYAALSGDIGAIRALSSSALTVNNYGTIAGNVDQSTSTIGFDNMAGGIFRPGGTVNLGGSLLTNAGTLSPGGTGTAQVTTLTGDLFQTNTGNYVVDVDEGGATDSDAINASGTADFAGTITPNVINITSQTGQVTIATASALTSTATATDVNGYDFSLSVLGGNALLLSWTLASPESIVALLTNANASQRAIAIYLDTLNVAGPTAAQQALIDALLALGETDLIAALNQLTPELYSDAQISSLYSSLGFANSLLSCKVNGTTTASIIEEGQCLWAGASASFLDQNTTASQLGFKETTGSFAAGTQVALDDNWRLGFAAGYQKTSMQTVTNAASDGDLAQAGVALKYNIGAAVLAGTVSGGRAWYDTSRPVAFTGFTGTATSQSSIDILNGGLRAAYVLGTSELYFKPVIDAAVTRFNMGGFNETGGGAANLAVQGHKQTVYTVAPSLEIGSEWWWANGTLVRPYVRGGATYYSGNDFALSASFLGAPAGLTPFTIKTDMDDVMGVAGAGLDMITAEDTVLHLAYDGQFGKTTSVQAVALKGSVRY